MSVVIDSLENTELKKIPSESVEAVALMNILFCVSSDAVRQRLMSEAKRILKPGGALIVVDMQRPSLFWLMSLLSGKGWKFRRHDELIQLMRPLEVAGVGQSNYFYFVNPVMNWLNRMFGRNICYSLNTFARAIGIPASTKTFVFKKSNGRNSDRTI